MSDYSGAAMDPVLPFRSMAYNNAWANHRLLSACAGLSQEEFEAERTGFFPSLRATLNHILIIDLFYVDALEGGTLGPAAWADREPCATVAELHEAQAAVDRRLIAAVEQLTPVTVDDDDDAALSPGRVRISPFTEADEADLLEQAIAVPLDDDLEFDR